MKNWRHTRDYRIWRAGVIRKTPKCIICNSIKNRQAHHINNGEHHPEGRFDVKNGITLCRKCHSIFHNSYVGSFRMKCTKKQWKKFNKLVKYIKSL